MNNEKTSLLTTSYDAVSSSVETSSANRYSTNKTKIICIIFASAAVGALFRSVHNQQGHYFNKSSLRKSSDDDIETNHHHLTPPPVSDVGTSTPEQADVVGSAGSNDVKEIQFDAAAVAEFETTGMSGALDVVVFKTSFHYQS